MADTSNGICDLHVHSIFSDGLLKPDELVRRAHQAGVKAISLTDHDCVTGVQQAEAEARSLGMGFIPGMELSTTFKGTDVHVLGYNMDVTDKSLLGFLERFEAARFSRAEKMVLRLRDQGLKIIFDDVKDVAGPGPIGRPHVAEALLNNGQDNNFDEAFMFYIGRHCPAYVKKYELSPREAIEIIRAAGGLSVLAHPLVGQTGEGGVAEIVEFGLDGLEAIHPLLTQRSRDWLEELAVEKGLIITGGSDYHGDGRSRVDLGIIEVPFEFANRLMNMHKVQSPKPKVQSPLP